MKNNAELVGRLMLVIVCALSASCGQKAAQQASTQLAQTDFGIPENPTWARAVIGSSQNQDLAAFAQKFTDLLGDTDLEKHLMGCTGCEQTSSSTSLGKLEYVFALEHTNILQIFGEAWATTRSTAADPDYSIKINANEPPAVCDAPAHPAPCQFMPFCSDACGRRTGGCGAC
jgi:hypothetical protein